MRTNQIICGDNIQVMKTLPDESIQCCITSPPYWGLRDYGTATWDGGDVDCDHKVGRFTTPHSNKQGSNAGSGDVQAKKICPKCGAKRIDNQLGLEKTPEEYVENLVKVFREVKRVLRDDGTLWLNLGDSYAGNNSRASNGGRAGYGTEREGVFNNLSGNLKPKDLVGIPWRVAFALQADGWYLRQDIIWHKPNPMPESVTDRCTKSHEYIFLLSKSQKYYYDHEAIKEPAAYDGRKDTMMKGSDKYKDSVVPGQVEHTMAARGHERWQWKNGVAMRNKRSVWTVATRPFKMQNKTSRWERVEQGVFYDGMKRIASPNCPVHGCQNLIDDECGGDEETRKSHIHNCLFREPVSEHIGSCKQSSRLKMENNSGLQDLQCLPFANRHSIGIHKTGHDPVTKTAYISCVQIPDHIARRLKEHGWTSPCLYNLVNNILLGGLPDNLLQQILSDRTDKLKPLVCLASETPSVNCLCSYYHKTTKKTSHFATFPPKLIEPCILAGCPKGGIIIDPFMGAGTVALVARENNRDFVGCELNPKYIEIANQRINNAQLSLF